jgi:hypothetical protein
MVATHLLLHAQSAVGEVVWDGVVVVVGVVGVAVGAAVLKAGIGVVHQVPATHQKHAQVS